MIIQNLFNNYKIQQNSNQKYNTNLISKNKKISFTGKQDVLTKTLQADVLELSKISFIADTYEKILKLIAPLNGVYQTKFKSMYPNLISGEKIKGFVFKSIDGFKDKRLQVVRFNTKNSSDELVTFGILNSENKNLVRFRVNKKGVINISSEKDKISDLEINPFEKDIVMDLKKYLQPIVQEFLNFNEYSANFKIINKNLKNDNGKKNLKSLISNINSIKSSVGIKSDSDLVLKNYNNLMEELNAKNQKHAILLKQNYWGKDYPFAGKGLYFQNLQNSKKNVTFCPLQSKDDNRIFKLVIQNNKNELENAFVFFDDGKVSTQKVKGLETNYFRSNNLVNISDSEIEKNEIKKIFQSLNNEFDKFKNFILEKRNEKLSKKFEAEEKLVELQKIKSEKLAIKEQKMKQAELVKQEKQKQKELKAQIKLNKENEAKRLKAEKLKEKELKKQELERIAKQKAQEKLNKAIELQKKKEEKQLELQRNKDLKEKLIAEKKALQEAKKQARLEKNKLAKQKLEQKLEKKLEKKVEKKVKQERIPELKVKTKKENSISKPVLLEEEKLLSKVENNSTLTVPMNYSAIRLNQISEGLDNLFNLPVEKRSPHLIHERLSNGNIFTGRFSFISQDGAKITVSRIKSPKYVDFTYYSIRASKNGEEFILNLDSEAGRIINSENGKPVINKKCFVVYTSKEEFLKQNPLAKNLPQYLNEIFEFRNNETRKIIDSNLKFKKRENILKQKEQDVLDALKSNGEEDFLN